VKRKHLRFVPAILLFLVALVAPGVGWAERFGPPWMARVSADQATVHTEPSSDSLAVGGLSKGALVIVLDQRDDWTRIDAGWLPSAEVAESSEPWIGQANASISVYAKPNAQSPIRRGANTDDLLLVTGVSKGLDGDTGLWWATTEGYVGVSELRQAAPDVAPSWARPNADEAPKGWWGEARNANVRAAPSSDGGLVGEYKGGARVKVLSEVQGQEVNGDATWYRVDGGRYPGAYVHASLIKRIDEPQPTITPPPADREMGDRPWIVVDRTAHTLTLLRGGAPVFVTYAAIGRAGRDTPEGNYTTYLKYFADRMTSSTVADAEGSYDLPNVPFPEYFKDDGSAVHGTYWHDAFGSDESQGCINLTWTDSAYLFRFTSPEVRTDQFRAQAPPEEATPLVIVH
jgi:lipoprotein-anchoring transpeptidase ErfK/SrfK